MSDKVMEVSGFDYIDTPYIPRIKRKLVATATKIHPKGGLVKNENTSNKSKLRSIDSPDSGKSQHEKAREATSAIRDVEKTFLSTTKNKKENKVKNSTIKTSILSVISTILVIAAISGILYGGFKIGVRYEQNRQANISEQATQLATKLKKNQ